MNKVEKLKYCNGCENNFYNGNNPYRIKECWSLKDSKLVLKKEIPITQYPPWKQKAIKVLDCFHRKGYVYWDKDREY